MLTQAKVKWEFLTHSLTLGVGEKETALFAS